MEVASHRVAEVEEGVVGDGVAGVVVCWVVHAVAVVVDAQSDAADWVVVRSDVEEEEVVYCDVLCDDWTDACHSRC